MTDTEAGDAQRCRHEIESRITTLTQQQGGEQEAGDGLPVLPYPGLYAQFVGYYTADQMRTYAITALRTKQPAASEVYIDFAQVGTAGPFPVIDGKVVLPDVTMADLIRHARTGYVPAASEGDGRAIGPGNLIDFPLYKALDALYDRGWKDYHQKRKFDARGCREWQAVYDHFHAITILATSKQTAGEAVALSDSEEAAYLAKRGFYDGPSTLSADIAALTTPPRHPADEGRVSPAAELWCLHILGPDDVHPAPSRAHAEKAAERFNAHFGPISERTGVRCSAIASPWPHSAESHAESVGKFCTEWLTPGVAVELRD